MSAKAKARFWKEREAEEQRLKRRKEQSKRAPPPPKPGAVAALQPYDYILVLDFEATCIESKQEFPNEIIEFPVVLLDTTTREQIAEFHSYVRPRINPKLSEFCTKLTGIKQAQVDAAPYIEEVLARFEKWVVKNVPEDKTAIMAADGPFDMQHFLFKCHAVRDRIQLPDIMMEYLDIRETFHRFFKVKRKGMKLIDILRYMGLRFQGNWHSGIDDARNIARLAATMMERGVVFRVPVEVTPDWRNPYLRGPSPSSAGCRPNAKGGKKPAHGSAEPRLAAAAAAADDDDLSESSASSDDDATESDDDDESSTCSSSGSGAAEENTAAAGGSTDVGGDVDGSPSSAAASATDADKPSATKDTSTRRRARTAKRQDDEEASITAHDAFATIATTAELGGGGTATRRRREEPTTTAVSYFRPTEGRHRSALSVVGASSSSHAAVGSKVGERIATAQSLAADRLREQAKSGTWRLPMIGIIVFALLSMLGALYTMFVE